MDYSTKEIAVGLGISRQAVMSRARAERWVFVGTGKTLRWKRDHLPADVLKAVAHGAAIAQDTDSAPSDAAFAAVREKDRETAGLRACMINLFMQSGLRKAEYIEAYNAGLISRPLVDRLGPVSLPTFYRWLGEWERAGRNLGGLVPRYAMKAQRGSGASISDIVKGYAQHLYLNPHTPSIGHVHRTLEDFERQGLIPQAPSYQTLSRYLNSLPPTVVAYWRKGRTKWAADFQSYIERDMDLYRPMELVTSDHVMLDFVVKKDGRVFRPWLTTVQDFRSGLVLGACPCVTPSWLSITVALFMMGLKYGRAEIFTVDNGQDYRCKVLNGQTGKFKTIDANGFEEEEEIYVAGSYQACVDRVSFTWAYAGQSKGRHERIHGIWQEYFSREMPTYIGSNTVTRPEDAELLYRAVNKRAKRDDVLSWEEFVTNLGTMLDYWNNEWRGTGKGMDGRTPREVFDALSGAPRPVDPNILELALSRSEKRRVRENGVKVDGVFYWALELQRYVGMDVIVRRPLADPETALICDPRGALLCRAKANYFLEGEDLADTIKRRKDAARSNLQLVRDLSTGRVAPPEGKRSILDARRGKTSDDYCLPLAVGGEHDPEAQFLNTGNARTLEDREKANAFLDLLSNEE